MKSLDRITIREFQRAVLNGTKAFQNLFLEKIHRLDFDGIPFANGTYFKNCYFRDVSLYNTNLSYSTFEDVTLEGLDIEGVRAENAKFINCKIIDAMIKHSNFTNADFSYLNQHAKETTGLEFKNCKLNGTLFSNANLEEFGFIRSSLDEAVFKSARMRHTILLDSQIQNADFTSNHNLTIQQFTDINIIPRYGGKYIGGISFENALRLFNLLLIDKSLQKLKDSGKIYDSDKELILGRWLQQAAERHEQQLSQVYRLGSSDIPNEKELIIGVLKDDLRVKGIDNLWA